MTRDMEIRVNTYANYPMYISITPDKFGELFASFGDDEQVECLKAMNEHMKAHPIQWDYISIELEKPEHAELKRKLKEVFGGD